MLSISAACALFVLPDLYEYYAKTAVLGRRYEKIPAKIVNNKGLEDGINKLFDNYKL